MGVPGYSMASIISGINVLPIESLFRENKFELGRPG
jgi:hypothetical protein